MVAFLTNTIIFCDVEFVEQAKCNCLVKWVNWWVIQLTGLSTAGGARGRSAFFCYQPHGFRQPTFLTKPSIYRGEYLIIAYSKLFVICRSDMTPYTVIGSAFDATKITKITTCRLCLANLKIWKNSFYNVFPN